MSVLTSESLPGTGISRSRDYCEFVTRTQAKNFYYGLKLLPEPKRSAMFTLYAYMRLVDDIADEEDGRTLSQRIQELEAWREQTHSIFVGGSGDHTDPPALGRIADGGRELWPAFAEMVREYNVPRHLFDDVIAGQRQDLEPEPFDTFEQLHTYCYRVAGVVGLASIYIWGFVGGAETEALAVDRGVAFQLTNILRDLREDAARGRTYLPLEDLAVMNVTEADLRGTSGGRAFTELMRFEIDRAESYYRKSAPLEDRIQRDSRPTLVAMTQIYHRLLKKVAVQPERVLRERVSLSLLSKLLIGWRAARSR
jgi:phytoene synthase